MIHAGLVVVAGGLEAAVTPSAVAKVVLAGKEGVKDRGSILIQKEIGYPWHEVILWWLLSVMKYFSQL